MTKRELYGVRDLRKMIHDTEIYVDMLRERVKNTTPILDGMPHAAPLDSRIERFMLEIAEFSRELEVYREELLRRSVTLTNKISRAVTDKQQRSVLLMRYVSCLSFKEICDTMDLSRSTVYALHRLAIENLDLRQTCNM